MKALLPWSLLNATWPSASSSPCLDFPSVMDCSFELCSKMNLAPLGCLCQNVNHDNRKRNPDRSHIKTWSKSRRQFVCGCIGPLYYIHWTCPFLLSTSLCDFFYCPPIPYQKMWLLNCCITRQRWGVCSIYGNQGTPCLSQHKTNSIAGEFINQTWKVKLWAIFHGYLEWYSLFSELLSILNLIIKWIKKELQRKTKAQSLTSFMSSWHKLQSSRTREPQLRKYPIRSGCRQACGTFS